MNKNNKCYRILFILQFLSGRASQVYYRQILDFVLTVKPVRVPATSLLTLIELVVIVPPSIVVSLVVPLIAFTTGPFLTTISPALMSVIAFKIIKDESFRKNN